MAQKYATVSSLTLFSLRHTHKLTHIFGVKLDRRSGDNVKWDMLCSNINKFKYNHNNSHTNEPSSLPVLHVAAVDQHYTFFMLLPEWVTVILAVLLTPHVSVFFSLTHPDNGSTSLLSWDYTYSPQKHTSSVLQAHTYALTHSQHKHPCTTYAPVASHRNMHFTPMHTNTHWSSELIYSGWWFIGVTSRTSGPALPWEVQTNITDVGILSPTVKLSFV